jgi:GNAT superfamily N-acetyltransferase
VKVASLGYRTDLMVLGLEGSQITDHGDHLSIASPASPDYWWGNFLLVGPPRPGDAARWLNQFAAEFPAARHVAIGVDVIELGGVPVADFEQAGLRLERSCVLAAHALAGPARPHKQAQYRELRGDADWQQAARLRAAVSAGGPGDDPGFIARRIRTERSLTEAGHGAWIGAFAGGELVAQLGIVTDGFGLARYRNVETHPDWRRRGLAGTLTWQAGQHALTELGASTLVIVADPLGDAIRVYRAIGFADAETQVGFERQPPGSG